MGEYASQGQAVVRRGGLLLSHPGDRVVQGRGDPQTTKGIKSDAVGVQMAMDHLVVVDPIQCLGQPQSDGKSGRRWQSFGVGQSKEQAPWEVHVALLRGAFDPQWKERATPEQGLRAVRQGISSDEELAVEVRIFDLKALHARGRAGQRSLGAQGGQRRPHASLLRSGAEYSGAPSPAHKPEHRLDRARGTR